MHKVFRFNNKLLHSTLQTYSKSPKLLLPISKFHSISRPLNSDSKLDFVFNEIESLNSSIPRNQILQESTNNYDIHEHVDYRRRNVPTYQISHSWPEWVDLMELLLKRGYFEKNENPFINGELGTKETNWIRTACLNFARDHFGLIRFLSRRDIHIISVCGCPIVDRKVVNSGKRLRAHVGINEGNVCSSCKLRGDCDRAYVKAREDEGGRTVDVMRILLTYGLDSVSGMLENKMSRNKMLKESVRRLLKEMVEYTSKGHDSDLPNATSFRNEEPLQGDSNVPMKQGDWLCPKCNFLNFARNIRCLRCHGLFQERLKWLHEDQDHLPLKRGDWICEKCNFLNFAKNTRCLQCEEKPSKRKLNPGEWECQSCNYINFRRNMVCLKCDHRRPKALDSPNNASSKLEKNNEGYHKDARLRFDNDANEAANDKSNKIDARNQRRDGGMWRFVDEGENFHSNLRDNDSKFVDFPIMGGKSILSQNEYKQERWKVEMLEQSQTTDKMRGSDKGEVKCAHTPFNYPETTDDEDIAEWFGHSKKMDSKCSLSATREIDIS